MVREFYANAYSTYKHPFCYTTGVAGKDVRFDREIINDYIGNIYQYQEDELCDYSRKVNQGNLNNKWGSLGNPLIRFICLSCPSFWPDWYVSMFFDLYQSSSWILWYDSNSLLWKFESIQAHYFLIKLSLFTHTYILIFIATNFFIIETICK